MDWILFGEVVMLPLKLTNFAPENGSHLEKEIPNLETTIFRGYVLCLFQGGYRFALMLTCFICNELHPHSML